jgi:hypothetical protein
LRHLAPADPEDTQAGRRGEGPPWRQWSPAEQQRKQRRGDGVAERRERQGREVAETEFRPRGCSSPDQGQGHQRAQRAGGRWDLAGEPSGNRRGCVSHTTAFAAST